MAGERTGQDQGGAPSPTAGIAGAPAQRPAPPDLQNVPPAVTVDLTGLTKSTAADVGVTVLSPASAPPANGGGSPTTVGFQQFSMDQTREIIALLLLGALLCIVFAEVLFAGFFSVNCWIFGACDARASKAIGIISSSVEPIFTAMIGLVGSVVGFYFGSKSTNAALS